MGPLMSELTEYTNLIWLVSLNKPWPVPSSKSSLTLTGLLSQMCDRTDWSLFKLTNLTNLDPSRKGQLSTICHQSILYHDSSLSGYGLVTVTHGKSSTAPFLCSCPVWHKCPPSWGTRWLQILSWIYVCSLTGIDGAEVTLHQGEPTYQSSLWLTESSNLKEARFNVQQNKEMMTSTA